MTRGQKTTPSPNGHIFPQNRPKVLEGTVRLAHPPTQLHRPTRPEEPSPPSSAWPSARPPKPRYRSESLPHHQPQRATQGAPTPWPRPSKKVLPILGFSPPVMPCNRPDPPDTSRCGSLGTYQNPQAQASRRAGWGQRPPVTQLAIQTVKSMMNRRWATIQIVQCDLKTFGITFRQLRAQVRQRGPILVGEHEIAIVA